MDSRIVTDFVLHDKTGYLRRVEATVTKRKFSIFIELLLKFRYGKLSSTLLESNVQDLFQEESEQECIFEEFRRFIRTGNFSMKYRSKDFSLSSDQSWSIHPSDIVDSKKKREFKISSASVSDPKTDLPASVDPSSREGDKSKGVKKNQENWEANCAYLRRIIPDETTSCSRVISERSITFEKEQVGEKRKVDDQHCKNSKNVKYWVPSTAQPTSTLCDNNPEKLNDKVLTFLAMVEKETTKDIYCEFLCILKNFYEHELNLWELMQRVAAIFHHDHSELLGEFNKFLPAGYELHTSHATIEIQSKSPMDGVIWNNKLSIANTFVILDI